MTPDFGSRGAVLYQWSQDSTSLSPAPASGLGPPQKASDLDGAELADLQAVTPEKQKNSDVTYSADASTTAPGKLD